MNHITPKEARSRRLRAGVRLIDVAVSANCAPATVRSFEFGAPTRAAILARLREAYRQLCADARHSTPPSAA